MNEFTPPKRIALRFSIVGYRMPVKALARMIDPNLQDSTAIDYARLLVGRELRGASGMRPSWEFDGDYVVFGKGYHLMPSHSEEDKEQLIKLCDFTELRRLPFGQLLRNVPVDVFEMKSRNPRTPPQA